MVFARYVCKLYRTPESRSPCSCGACTLSMDLQCSATDLQLAVLQTLQGQPGAGRVRRSAHRTPRDGESDDAPSDDDDEDDDEDEVSLFCCTYGIVVQ